MNLLKKIQGACVVAAMLAAAPAFCQVSKAIADPNPPRGSLPLRNAIQLETHGVWLMDPKIVGGRLARQGDDPWQVALIRSSAVTDRRPFCGGTLLLAGWVVTAAHCVDNRTLSNDLDVLGGVVDVGEGGVRVKVSEIIVHPDYSPQANQHSDIALLRLQQPLTGPGISTIPALPIALEPNALRSLAPARVTGWGTLGENGSVVRELRTVDLTIYTNNDCNDRVAYNGKIAASMVCAGFKDASRDSCQGDSGGPLTVAVVNTRYLAGIVSWGDGCARANKFGVYTRVAHFSEWIALCAAGKPECRVPSRPDSFAMLEQARLIKQNTLMRAVQFTKER